MPLYSYICQSRIRTVVFDEPHEDGNREIRVTAEEAIKAQRLSVEMGRGSYVRAGFNYSSDEEALGDFIAVHWARVEISEPCGHVVDDVLQGIKEAPLTLCPACGRHSLARQIGSTSFILHGGGWASDGYGSKQRSKP